MLKKILELIKEKPKHYAKIIKNSQDLLTWVKEHSTAKNDNIAAQIYSAISNTSDVCALGHTKRFISINDGWGFCGRANICACAANSVKEKCTINANTRDWTSSVEKRRSTNLKKYGHVNAAQSQSAKENHRNFFADEQKKQQAFEKFQKTFLDRYGVDNPAKLEHVKEKKRLTFLEKYGVDNPQKNVDINKKSLETKKQKYNERYLLETSYDRMFKKYQDLGYTLLVEKENYQGTNQKNVVRYQFRHESCGHIFETYIYSSHLPVCPVCYYKSPSFVSKAEKEIGDWIESHSVSVIRTERNLISPLHIDIYLPHHKLAIEYCGLYWHAQNSNGKLSSYHNDKLQKCNSLNIDLITIFEDEWLTNKELVKSIIQNKLGLSEKLGARKCEIKSISNLQAKQFIDQNHLQSYIPASINLALYYQNEIISIMTFGKSRYNKKYEWEILRFCHKQGFNVIGGAQRLWKFFIKSINPKSVISYCDLRWFTGNTYEKLGMTLLHQTPPSYWYTNYQQRYHRSNFTKKKLIKQGYDATKTEEQIMFELKFDKIWDCGNKVFVFNAY